MLNVIRSWFEPKMPDAYLAGVQLGLLQKELNDVFSVDLDEIQSTLIELAKKPPIQTAKQEDNVTPVPDPVPPVQEGIYELQLAPSKITLSDSLDANGVFDEIWGTAHDIEWNSNWGGSARGYRGLLNSSPMPGLWKTSDPVNGVPVLFHVDNKGPTLVFYQLNNVIRWNAPTTVTVSFQSDELSIADMLMLKADLQKRR